MKIPPDAKRLILIGALSLAVIGALIFFASHNQSPPTVTTTKAPPAAERTSDLLAASDTSRQAAAPQPPSAPQPSISPATAPRSAGSANTGSAAPAAAVDRVEGYTARPAQSGERAAAVVEAEGKKIELSPNQIGNFQRVQVSPKAAVPVRVVYPDAQEGQAVVAEAQDGGTIKDSGSILWPSKLNNEKAFAFTFAASENPGMHRIVLRKGADVKQLDFWVGPQIPPAEER